MVSQQQQLTFAYRSFQLLARLRELDSPSSMDPLLGYLEDQDFRQNKHCNRPPRPYRVRSLPRQLVIFHCRSFWEESSARRCRHDLPCLDSRYFRARYHSERVDYPSDRVHRLPPEHVYLQSQDDGKLGESRAVHQPNQGRPYFQPGLASSDYCWRRKSLIGQVAMALTSVLV